MAEKQTKLRTPKWGKDRLKTFFDLTPKFSFFAWMRMAQVMCVMVAIMICNGMPCLSVRPIENSRRTMMMNFATLALLHHRAIKNK